MFAIVCVSKPGDLDAISFDLPIMKKMKAKSISHASRFAELMNGSQTSTLTGLTHLILTSKNRLNFISPTDENQVVILEGELKS